MEPGIPRVQIAQRSQISPCPQQSVLNGILSATVVAEDEVGDAFEPRERQLHQLGEGVEIPILGSHNVDNDVMDQIWQRYLESMPDPSVRRRFMITAAAAFDFSLLAYRMAATPAT